MAAAGARFIRTAVLSLPLLAGGGCVRGLIYTDITRPLMTDADRSAVCPAAVRSNQTTIKEPISPVGLQVDWAGYGIGQAAKNGNLQTVCAADVRRQSVLLGLWKRTTVIVYGREGAAPKPQ